MTTETKTYTLPKVRKAKYDAPTQTFHRYILQNTETGKFYSREDALCDWTKYINHAYQFADLHSAAFHNHKQLFDSCEIVEITASYTYSKK